MVPSCKCELLNNKNLETGIYLCQNEKKHDKQAQRESVQEELKNARAADHGSISGRNRFGYKIDKFNKHGRFFNYWLWSLIVGHGQLPKPLTNCTLWRFSGAIDVHYIALYDVASPWSCFIFWRTRANVMSMARPAAETLQVWLRSLRSCIQESGTAKNYRPYLSTLLCATVMHITRLPDKS